MQVGTLVKHRVSDRIGIILRHTNQSHWKVVHWDNGVVLTAQIINLVALCK